MRDLMRTGAMVHAIFEFQQNEDLQNMRLNYDAPRVGGREKTKPSGTDRAKIKAARKQRRKQKR